MFFPRRLTIPRVPSPKTVNRLRHPRRNRHRAGFASRQTCCAPGVEALEGRQMLSAVSVVAPPVKPGYVIAQHLGSSIQPADQPQNASAPYNPQQIQTAYGLSTGSVLNNNISFNGIVGNGAGQTIAIVDAYNDPNIVSDTEFFNTEFNLPQFNVSGGPTFQVLNENGGTSLSGIPDGQGWDVEESLDVQWVHSMAPEANIILFEANTSNGSDLYQAEATAADSAGVSVVSNSWGGGEFSGENELDSTFTTPSGHQGVTFLAGSGDDGSPGLYPAFSPNVVAVGGTSLQIQSNGAYISESVWNDLSLDPPEGATGGGISTQEPQPSYQVGKVSGISATQRLSADVSADADPVTGVYVYDTYSGGGWLQIGGTSLATPLWAGMIGIADQGRVLAGEGTLDGPSQTLPMLYDLPSSDFHNITQGNNGTYSAGPGYNIPSGLGTPVANLIIPALAGTTVQPPTITAPSAAGVTENSLLVFSTTNGNAISIADGAATNNSDSLSLSVTHGTLTLGSTTGLTFTSGSNNSASLTVSGPIADLDAAVTGLTYQPGTNYLGPDTLSITLSDSGTNQSAQASVSLTVVAPATGTWTTMTNAMPNKDTGQAVLLAPNGQLLVHGFAGSDADWYLVTPASTGSYVDGTWTQTGSMNVGREGAGTDVLPNGEVFAVGGANPGNLLNSTEIYNMASGTWTLEASDPQQFDSGIPTELLPDGNILVGDPRSNGTEIYDPANNTWSAGGSQVHNDETSGDVWVKLPNGDILSYDTAYSIALNTFSAEIYNPTTNTWTDASTSSNGSTLPLLSNGANAAGPAVLLPDGQALFLGGAGITMFFNPSNDTWTQGPTMPSVTENGTLTQLAETQGPVAVLPDGDVVMQLQAAFGTANQNDTQQFIYDLNPTAGVFTNITPPSTIVASTSLNLLNTMLILPTGQLLLVDQSGTPAIYTPNGSPQPAWQPTITNFVKNTNGSYTLTGTQLNGLDEGAAYGEDINEMAENYPLVQVTDLKTGTISYATTSDWSLVGAVATGSTPKR